MRSWKLEKRRPKKLSRAKLIEMILEQREDMHLQLEEEDKQITELTEQLAKQQGKIDKERDGPSRTSTSTSTNRLQRNRNGTRTATRN